MRPSRWVSAALVTALLTLAGFFLGTPVARAGTNQGRISLRAGLDFPTAYYFRGILQEDEDFIAQPYASATFSLYDGGTSFNSVSATAGIWNSFHAGPTGGGGPNQSPESWYEADLYAGLTFGFLDSVEVAGFYTAYTSPNGLFTTVHELAWSLNVDDSKFLGAFALSPHIVLAFEVDGQADGGANEGIYLEIGIEPGFTLLASETYPIAVSFPLTLGLSANDYYEDPNTGADETFGYFDGGIAVTVPLAFVPPDFGTWQFYASAHFLVLGDSLETFNNGDDFKALGIFGFSLEY